MRPVKLIDFLRFNAFFATEIYRQQPRSGPAEWNHLEYRPLEGFVFAVTPFNFTAIGGNLPSAPAMLGNTVLWKPASIGRLFRVDAHGNRSWKPDCRRG
jgi:1-pyrroline-5-carboxylate dehydrogenase